LKVDLEVKIEPGTLLVAHPLLLGSVYERSVILICQHSDKLSRYSTSVNEPTTIGLILNNYKQVPEEKPLVPKQIGDITLPGGAVLPVYFPVPVQEKKETKSTFKTNLKHLKSQQVNLGGVKSRGEASVIFKPRHFAEQDKNLDPREARSKGIIKIKDDLFWGPSKYLEAVDSYIEEDKIQEWRLYNGQTTWTVGQLKKEISMGCWTLVKCEDVFELLGKDTTNEHAWNKIMRNLGGEFASWQNFPTDIHQ
jgi:putative AlgH/UPF0301 family transcriptional regulator